MIIDLLKCKHLVEKDVLSSELFSMVSSEYFVLLKRANPQLYNLVCVFFDEKNIEPLRMLFDRLLVEHYSRINCTISKSNLLSLLDGIYDLWRSKERFGIIDVSKDNYICKEYITDIESFSQLITSTYRKIYENIIEQEQIVYRQLPSGINSGIIVSTCDVNLPKELLFLKNTKIVRNIIINPPYICNTASNTRSGVFVEKKIFLSSDSFNVANYLMLPIIINEKIGFIYVNKKYLRFIVSLGNLFQIADLKYCSRTPSFIVFFGINSKNVSAYYNKLRDVYIGYVPDDDRFDYFGYLKKIILTLYNLLMIDKGMLPIHGAGISISLSNGMEYNVVILGDSGAGKSETIEHFRKLFSERVNKIKVIFDDMGTFLKKDNEIYCRGTEIGAFVRLDDLDKGYILKSMDRAIFMNIDKTNSRVVLPIETYDDSCFMHKVDMFLLADNFTDTNIGIKRFLRMDAAIKEFIMGKRMAKGTTSEEGIVTSFFANPFGPLQKQKESSDIIREFFCILFEKGVYVGKLYTKLALDPYNGPEYGATKLYNLLNQIKKI